MTLPNSLLELCRISDLPESRAKGFKLLNQSYIAVKSNGDIFVYINRCPHADTPLDWEPDDFIDGDTGLLRCATHGALFELNTGECVVGPCIGDYLTAVESRIEQDRVYIKP